MSTSTNYNHARNLKHVYVFDGRENPIGDYETVTSCAEALNVSRQAVTMAVARGSILDKKYYVSYEEKFTRQQKQKEFNPLRPSVKAPRPVASKATPKKVSSVVLRNRSIFSLLQDGMLGPFTAFH